MIGRPMSETAQLVTHQPSAGPYPPSFVRRILDALNERRGAGWTLYAVVAAGVVLLEIGVAWLEGTLPARARPMHAVLPIFAVAALPALALFGRVARRSLQEARPMLVVDERGYDDLTYRLTTPPARSTLAAAAGGLLALLALTAFQPPDTFQRLQIMVTPVATVLECVLQFLTWTGIGVVAFEIARRLVIIDEIYRHHVRINLLNPGPVYALARLSAVMVVFTMSAVAVGTFALAELATTAQWAVAAGAPTLLAAVAFVAPLWGAHRALAEAKARELGALGEEITTTIRTLRDRVASQDRVEVGPLRDALQGLIAARDEYAAVSTWPWQRSTLGGVVTALIAPLAVWLLTRIMESASVL
jgi:hypothetical protein